MNWERVYPLNKNQKKSLISGILKALKPNKISTMTLLKSINVETRKPHECMACCRPFPAGAFMRYEAWADEGEIIASYTCNTCVQIMAHIYEYGDDIEYGCVSNELRFNETPEEFLKTLTK